MSGADLDARRMRRALTLAARGVGRVSPNPLVGAVVVDAAGEVAGEGAHERFGGPHAEVAALRAAGERARGGTLYVSLEPCAHHGKTPPCTDAILAAGLHAVVYAVRDPDPAARGGGEVLRRSGLEVREGVLRGRAVRRNLPFFWWQRRRAPFVVLKLALSMDGRIAGRAGRRTALTGPRAARATMRLRATSDAILVGGGTARVDDPLLTVRSGDVARPPVRVVLDSRARLAPESRLVRSVDEAPLLVFTAPDADPARQEALRAAGCELEAVPRDPAGGLEPAAVLARLGERGVRKVLCEGGGELAGSLLARGLVQRVRLHVAPVVLGPGGVPAFGVAGSVGPEWRLRRVRRLGRDAGIEWEHEAVGELLREV
ncbi:MAG: bifunctional diaminohydroxyphosphoribosylaminopyrimidine deaminase/5-amino-6-(5-phosphoribosylamino)uracil reductase RibD [Gemmatimonadota bacterium]|nr:bifunctional diaminohydroxyphosphoribosylaminopyrimidine deaminase/5-amino-6-(5-phosphoribosylamino)uracil reductase RibD [Gemmatimonadota bacterium]